MIWEQGCVIGLLSGVPPPQIWAVLVGAVTCPDEVKEGGIKNSWDLRCLFMD